MINFKQHALARAALSEDRQRLALRHFQIDSVQHFLFAERLAQCFHLNRRCGFRGFRRCRHGKNTWISRTSSTSARMMKSEERTTELVAARSTPSVPPCARIP